MHTETFSITKELVQGLYDSLKSGRPVTAVGTTSVRTLESLPYLGMHISEGDTGMNVTQWEAYSRNAGGDIRQETLCALRSILDFLDSHGQESLTASTSIMIAPGFRWRIVNNMVTNFHQPQSTLLLLVSSFLGDMTGDGTAPRWKRLYDEALKEGYRFLSYGDACFFSRGE